MSSWVAQTPVGQEAKVAILREGSEKQLTLKIEKFGSEEAQRGEICLLRSGKVGPRVGRPESSNERLVQIQKQPWVSWWPMFNRGARRIWRAYVRETFF